MRRIAVFTGNRAEYGLQYPILRAIANDERLEYDLLVGGAHLEGDFGKTITEIEKDGFCVGHKVDIRMDKDDLASTTSAIASCISSVAGILQETRPDFLLIYADRFESFGALVAGTQMSVPTAHVEGGDYTEGGALDDSVRHAMTKLAHLHFTTNEQAAERIRRMGEESWRVQNVGFPALDLVRDGLYASRDEVLRRYNLDPDRPIVLFCQHSVTTEFERAGDQIKPSLAALKRAAAEGVQVILTYPNNDAGGRRIIKDLDALISEQSNGMQLHASLGRYYFHGMLAILGECFGVFAGNSSAGIKETPAFGCPAINIGSRQDGRLRGENVIDTRYDADEIYNAIQKSVGDHNYRIKCRNAPNPYGAGDAGPRIAEALATIPIDQNLIRKRMTY